MTAAEKALNLEDWDRQGIARMEETKSAFKILTGKL